MNQPKLYLCYSINDFFAREAGISMLGFFENNPDYEPEEVFFIDYGPAVAHDDKEGGWQAWLVYGYSQAADRSMGRTRRR